MFLCKPESKEQGLTFIVIPETDPFFNIAMLGRKVQKTSSNYSSAMKVSKYYFEKAHDIYKSVMIK